MRERVLQPCAACASHGANPQLAPAPRRPRKEEHDGGREAAPVTATASFAAPAEVTRGIAQARGGGRALDVPVRSHMESTIGSSFESVRVHTDARAHQLAKGLNARAFTVGTDVFFRHGEYAPNQSAGRSILAHELKHVDQQARNQVPAMPQATCAECGGGGGITVRPASDRFEREADEAARLANRAVEQEPDSEPAPRRRREETSSVVQRFCESGAAADPGLLGEVDEPADEADAPAAVGVQGGAAAAIAAAVAAVPAAPRRTRAEARAALGMARVLNTIDEQREREAEARRVREAREAEVRRAARDAQGSAKRRPDAQDVKDDEDKKDDDEENLEQARETAKRRRRQPAAALS
jgi:uncharacterized protein DUF4157